MAKRIAQLIVDIEANTASLNKGFQEARQSVDRFGSQVKATMKAVGASFAIREIGHFLKSQIDIADQFHKLSQRTGVAASTLSSYAHAARLAGVSTDGLAMGFARLSRGMLDAAGGSKEQAAAFKALGVELRSGGGLRSLDEVLGDVAQGFAQMADGATKSALAQQLFGKSGAELIPFLNLGREGIAQARKEAERLGIVISSEFAAQAEQFNDSLTRMKARLEGVAITAAGPVVMAVNQMFDAMEGRLTGFKNKADLFGSPLFALLKEMVPGWGLALGQMEKRLPELGIQRTPAEHAAASMDSMFAAGHKAMIRARQEAALLNSQLRDKAAAEFRKQLEGAAAALHDARAQLTLGLLGPRGVFGMGGNNLPAVPSLKQALGLPESFETAGLAETGFVAQLRDVWAEFDEHVKGLQSSLKETMPLWAEMKGHMEGISAAGLQGIGDALMGLQSWKQLARQVLADLGRMLWYLLVVKPLMAGLFGGVGGGIFSIFGGGASSGFTGLLGSGMPLIPLAGARAAGGPVLAGQMYETHGLGRREFFVPKTDGHIVTRETISGSQVVNVDARGADIGTVTRLNALFLKEGFREFVRRQADLATRTV